MNLKSMRIILIIVLFLAIFQVAAGANTYYLRGSSETVTAVGEESNELSTTIPGISSSKTTATSSDAGRVQLMVWVSELATSNLEITGTASLYISDFGISGDTGDYRWSLNSYDQQAGNFSIIVTSDWVGIPTTKGETESAATILSYTWETGNHLELILEFQSDNDLGTVTLDFDEGSSGSSTSFTSPNNIQVTLNDVESAIILVLNDGIVIACSQNSDCDDSNSLTTDTCSNAGTGSSSCSNVGSGITVACYESLDCDDSNSLTTDTCSNAGTGSSSCSSSACSIVCENDSACDDGNADTADSCSNAGTCNAECSNVAIEILIDDEIVCVSNALCDDGISTTTDVCENPGTVSSACVNTLCGIACSNNDACDDGSSLTNDSCLNPGTCEASCNNAACNPICTSVT